ncbi:MAG: methyltransferase domain-containing protein [Acidobacteriota bacterium]
MNDTTQWPPAERNVADAVDFFDSPTKVEVYDRFQATFMAPGRRLCLELALAKLGRPPTSVLEIGCGKGQLLEILAARFPDARLTGFDTSETMVEEARARVESFATVLRGDLSSLADDLPPADLVISYSNFRFWKAPVDELAVIERILLPGGLAYITDLRRDFTVTLRDQLMERVETPEFQGFLGLQLHSAYTADEVGAIIEALRSETCEFKIGQFGGSPVLSREAFDLIQRHDHLAKAVFAIRSNGFRVEGAMDAMMHIYLHGTDRE